MEKRRDHLIARDKKNTAFASAKRLFAYQDYEGCLEELTRVDSALLTDEIIYLRKQAESNWDRLVTLRTLIHAAFKEDNLHDGLLSQVEAYLKLQREDTEMEKRRDHLIARDKTNTSYSTAKCLFAGQDYEGCLAELAQIDSSMLSDEILSFRQQASRQQVLTSGATSSISLNGKQAISYYCPQCKEPLRNPFEEAGQFDVCPLCKTEFFVPLPKDSPIKQIGPFEWRVVLAIAIPLLCGVLGVLVWLIV